MPEKPAQQDRLQLAGDSTADSALAETSDATSVGNPALASAAPGERVGRYAICGTLGQGGFGIVYLARDEDLGREVAVKLPRFATSDSPEAIERFLQEARTAARIKHPGIVPVFDVGRAADGRPFVVMLRVEGQSLQQRLQAGPPLDHQHAAHLMASVAEAVAHAHKQGLVHRDLKPGNILIDAGGQPLVADFGLAVDERQLRERAGELAGTLQYMSPEQVQGDVNRIDGRADIWSLGVMLYQLLTGRLPFTGDRLEALTDEICHKEPRPPRMIDESIPPALEQIVLKCLRKPVAERYSTAHDVARDLRNWMRPSQAVNAWAVSAAAGCLVMLAGAIAIWRMSLPPADPAAPSARPQATDAAAAKEAELAALIAELRGLRRDLGEAANSPRALPPASQPKVSDPPPSAFGATDPVPLPAGFAALEAELNAARAAGNDEEEDGLLLRATNELIEGGHYAIAERLALRMVEIAGNDPSDVPFAYGQLGLAQYRQGKFPEALASYERANASYRSIYEQLLKLPDTEQVIGFRSGAARLLGLTLMRIGNVHKAAKDYSLAEAAYEEAMQVFEAQQRNQELITLLLNYGGLESIRGNYDSAIRHLERGLALAREAQNAEEEAEFLVNLGNAYSRKGDNQTALQQYELAREKVKPDSNYVLRSALLINWSTSLLEEGQPARARELLLELQLFARPDDQDAQRVLEFLPALNRALGGTKASP